LVVGALPFDGLTPATLVVPRVTVRRRSDGSVVRVTTGPDQDPAADIGEPPETRPGPVDRPGLDGAGLAITPVPEPAAYAQAVDRARHRIARGELKKVVLARMLVVRSARELDRRTLLARLRDADPDAYT